MFPLMKSLKQPSISSSFFKNKNVTVADNLLLFQLAPKQQWEKTELERSNFNEKTGENSVLMLQNNALFHHALEKFNTFRSKERNVHKELGLTSPFEELEISFLGTGVNFNFFYLFLNFFFYLHFQAALPSLHRNVSGCLVDFGNICFMLDCGEGSWGQMTRRYGKENSEKLLKKMKFIFISHNHADHHMGITRILNQREMVNILFFFKFFYLNFFLDFRERRK
jgi:hypothetical protein